MKPTTLPNRERSGLQKSTDLTPQAFQLAQKAIAELIQAFPDFKDSIVGIRGPLRKKILNARALDGVAGVEDILNICPIVGSQVLPDNVPEELRRALEERRREIGKILIASLYEKQGVFGDAIRERFIAREKDFALLVSDIVPQLRQKWHDECASSRESSAHVPLNFDQVWIRETIGDDAYESLRSFVTTRDTRVAQWERFKRMLPDDLYPYFSATSKSPKEEELLRLLQEYRPIAETLGADTLAQFLISAKRLELQNLSRVIGLISQYLGRCATRVPRPKDIVEYPEALLRHTEVRDLIFTKLRNFLYLELVKDGYDERDCLSHQQRLQAEKDKIARILEDKGGSHYAPHRQLFADVLERMEHVISIETPARMIPAIEDRESHVQYVPSLRQKIAMDEIERDRRKLIAFSMGKGKTATAFLAKEHVGAKKMLYICPTKLVEHRQIEEQVRKHYREGAAPSVGIISAGITPERLEAALQCEIVVFPYSMFGSKVGGRRVTEYLKDIEFDFVTVDEVHNVRKETQRDTRVVSDLVNNIRGFQENGYLALLSAEPMPNGPEDITAQLKLLDPKTYGDMQSLREILRKVDPLRLRNSLLQHILILDEPVPWEEHIRPIPYQLHDDERRFYDSILLSDHLDTHQKLQLLYLFLINPELFGIDGRSSLFETVTQKAEELLESNPAIIIVENDRKEGVSRDHSQYAGHTFYDRLHEYFSTKGVQVCRIDGNTPPEERRQYFEDSRREDPKTILFCMRDCFGEGLDNLSHISDMIELEPWYNLPDTAQALYRGNRRNPHGRGEMYQCIARGTIHEGIRDHAEYKRDLVKVVLSGGILTRADLDVLEKSEIGDRITIGGRKILVGTHIMRSILSPSQQLQMHLQHLYGKGEKYFEEYLQGFGNLIAELYTENWERSYSGNNARFVTGLLKILESQGNTLSRVADIGCGNLVLENTWGLHGQTAQRQVVSLDLNGPLMETGKRMLSSNRPQYVPHVCRAGMTALPQEHFPSTSFDAVNCSLALPYVESKDRLKDKSHNERVKTLCEFHRILKPSGLLVITLGTKACTDTEFKNFTENALPALGFLVVPEFTGTGESLNDLTDHHFENHTIVCRKVSEPDFDTLDLKDLRFSRPRSHHKKEGIRKIRKAPEDHAEGYVHSQFGIRGTTFEYKEGFEKEISAEARQAERVARTQTMLLDLYETHDNSLDNLTPDLQGALRERGIHLFPLYTGDGTLWCFNFLDEDEEGGHKAAWTALPPDYYQKILKAAATDAAD